MLGSADERGVDVRGLVWRSHLDQTGFFATENRHLGERLQHRGAEVLLDMRVRDRRLAPPEVRGDPPPRRPVARRGMGRRHRPRPQPARRRRAPRRPAVPAAGRRVRRPPAVARRAGPHPGTRRARGGDRLPRAVGGPHAAEPQPAAARSPTACAASTSARTRCPRRRPRRRAAGDAPRAAAAHLPQPPARPRLPVRPRRRAERGPRLHQGDPPGASAWSTSRTSTSGATTWPSRSSRRCASTPSCAWSWSSRSSRTSTVGSPDPPSCSGAPGRCPRLMDAAPGPGGGVRHREPRRHAGLRPRQGVRHGRRLGQRRVGQLQPALVDPRLRAVVRRARRGLRPLAAARLAAEHLDRLDDVGDGLDEAMRDVADPHAIFDAFDRRPRARWTRGTQPAGDGAATAGTVADACRCTELGPLSRPLAALAAGPRARPRRPARPAARRRGLLSAAGAGRAGWRCRGRGASYDLARR